MTCARCPRPATVEVRVSDVVMANLPGGWQEVAACETTGPEFLCEACADTEA